MKLSVYEFKDLARTYVIIEHDNPKLLEFFSKLSLQSAKKIVSSLLSEVTSVKLSKGKMLYGDEELDFVYLSIETMGEGDYKLEVYPRSATLEASSDPSKAYEVAKRLMEITFPGH
ncbi:MAG: hypothetical protein B6U69_02790 [Thermofilum sp. ex4484_15]|nr:MAG: hypothetical protein B6U69_02790 [Thermofilum sp. ex4484_15]